ncbi:MULTISPECIES: SelD-related putative sulfur metabolism protein [Metallosphaera]|nr:MULTISPECIES: SelD-related putative sulfur metabolism protein [Metallosphaera]AKV75290.1 selenophosphate synthetase [Metallosphaera sedula]AKV77529.1 selenophosphate synthetase [Metallosphaera sedula]AKV79776.1 selenophosphate synthetase [Metallosphaera sedula]AKV82021.1 selenophosphate synthetase [Metallosphaera sedula]AKV84257.1 selenophosphate synthetase [Metallosphaera sedula]
MGLNPLSLATGCAVKVDLIDTVYPALEKLKDKLRENNIEVMPREDTDIFVSRESEVIKRVINGGEFDADRAVSLIQVNQETAGNPEKFANFLLKIYTSVKTRRRLVVGKGHSIVTTNPKAEVGVLDLIKLDGKALNSYTLANNDTIQIVDPLDDPGSQMQVDVGISNSLNDLFTKGAFQELRMIPVADAPDPELKETLMRNFESFSKRYGVELLQDIQPQTGTLMIGATVIGKSDHELPVFYSRVDENMEILVTRPVGELTPINVHMWLLTVPELLETLEERGITLQRVEEAKKRALDYMTKPNFATAKVIYEHLPEFGKEFDPKAHIAMTTDVTGPGIFVIKEFADKASVDVELYNVPVIDREINEFATENFIIPNSTAGTNGAIVMFASRKVIDDVAQSLSRAGLEPSVIGRVIGKGNGTVYVKREVCKLIHRENILKYFKVKDPQA